MRILFPIMSRWPSFEAPTIQATNMAQAFAELGHVVALVTPAPHPDPWGDGRQEQPPADVFGFEPEFVTHTLSPRIRRGQSYLHAVRIDRLALRTRTDLMFSRNLRACLLPVLRGTPTILEVHTLTSIQDPQERWVLKRLVASEAFRGIVAISGGLATDLKNEGVIDPERILTAHDGVRPGPSPSTWTGPSGSSGRLRVGYSGALLPGRGVELLVDVAMRCDWVELHLIGGPTDRADALRRRLVDSPVADRVVLHGMRTPEETRALQREMDALVAPFAKSVSTDSGVDSSRWMSPMKVFEYMDSGRPIVISDLPVLREVLRPEIDALMVEPEAADALVAALERLRRDPALGVRLASSARSRVQTEFTWQSRAAAILERFAGPGSA